MKHCSAAEKHPLSGQGRRKKPNGKSENRFQSWKDVWFPLLRLLMEGRPQACQAEEHLEEAFVTGGYWWCLSSGS